MLSFKSRHPSGLSFVVVLAIAIGFYWVHALLPSKFIHYGRLTACTSIHARLLQPLMGDSTSSISSTSGIVEAELKPEETIVAKQRSIIDPLLRTLFDESSESTILFLGGIREASVGIAAWRNALVKGRQPVPSDFSLDATKTIVWPPEPLFSRISSIMADIQLARFTLRHPATISAVLLSLLQIIIAYKKQGSQSASDEYGEEESDDYDQAEHCTLMEHNPEIEALHLNENSSQNEKLELIADDLAKQFSEEWGGVISGVNALDSVFGYQHGLLDVEQSSHSANGFGIQDDIWKHSGWQLVPDLQKVIASIPELKQLMQSLGRRPTTESSDSFNKFPPRRLYQKGEMAAYWDPHKKESIDGITLSNNISEMLPSEAVLLSGQKSVMRMLFLSKLVESKLLSYQSSGFHDVPTIPRQQTSYYSRLPSAVGGPIIVCLDTSWSMTGMREQISKAVVVACVSLAHKQHRDCQVVAFSTENDVMEAGIITADAVGVRRLLDFLSHSFGGGTDVTGALKHAMTTLTNDAMSSADILLITDGEIPDPPVSNAIMGTLDDIKKRTGAEVHGLLVGKRESLPLSKLCTSTHDFLVSHDMLAGLAEQKLALVRSISSRSCSSRSPPFGLRLADRGLGLTNTIWGYKPVSRSTSKTYSRMSLHAKYSKYDDEELTKSRKWKSRNKSRNDWDNDDIYWDTNNSNDDNDENDHEHNREISKGPNLASNFPQRVEDAISRLFEEAKAATDNDAWTPDLLELERNSDGSCWRFQNELQAAVDRVSEGLVEREEEARLVVLAMIAQEHILLLGPPGTAKSVLGRRLSKICGGRFFLRTLTRFTTPEELFGPLSLRALENDEYKRCSVGFLPTASIAFLDEIFKANSAILNTLLTILNERQFENGGTREECPLRCVVGASNELPESDELDALYDRFMLRKEVLPVSDEGLVRLLSLPSPGISPCDDGNPTVSTECDTVFAHDLDLVVRDLSLAADSVVFGDDAAMLMRDLRTYLRDDLEIDVSDRRMVKAARLLKLCAACHGRRRVDALDCLMLQHITWKIPSQRILVQEWLWENLAAGIGGSSLLQFQLLLDGLRREACTVVRKTTGDVTGDSGASKTDLATLDLLRTEVNRLTSLLHERVHDLSRHKELVQQSTDHLWLDPDQALAAKQVWLPKTEAIRAEAEGALINSRSLALSLSGDSLENDLRLSVIEQLFGYEGREDVVFTDEELNMSMKEAKSKYDGDNFRAWKRARKKMK